MYIRIIIHVGKISSSSFGLSHSLPLGKQTIARLKTNNTQVFVYIIYENTRSPRLLRADLTRTLRIQTYARSVERLSRSSSHRRSQRQPAQIWIFFLRCLFRTFSHSLSFFPLWNFTEAPRRQSPFLATTNSFRVRRFFGESIEWCLQERRGPVKRECLMKESVKVRSERSLSL